MLLRAILLALSLSMALPSCASPAGDAEAGRMTPAQVVDALKEGKGLVVRDIHITGDLNLTEAGSGWRRLPMSNVRIEGEIVFIGCVFEGKVSAKERSADGRQIVATAFGADVSFEECTFMSGVDFGQCAFAGRLDVQKSVFREKFSMDGCHVAGGMLTNGASFWGGFSASMATFGPRSSFVGTEWRQGAALQMARFECDAVFANSTFGGAVNLSSVRANGMLSFAECRFGGRVVWQGAHLLGPAVLAGATFADMVSLQDVVAIGDFDVTEAKFAADVKAPGATFLRKPDFSQASLASGVKVPSEL